jgi:phage-related baseplate assembly protein
LAAGTLCCLDPSTPGATAASVTATYGGGDTETDAAYRARLLLAPARHGGGTADGYRLAALSTSPDVIDALAVRHIGRAGSAPDGEPSPDAPSGADTGNILLYVMAKDGIEASQGLCAMVEARCNRSDVRLIGDWITAVPASTVPYTISAAVTLRHGNDAAEILDKARALAHAFGATHNTALGADVTPTQITLALAPLADAIYTIDLQRPAATIEIGKSEWAKLEGVEITLAGVVDE